MLACRQASALRTPESRPQNPGVGHREQHGADLQDDLGAQICACLNKLDQVREGMEGVALVDGFLLSGSIPVSACSCAFRWRATARLQNSSVSLTHASSDQNKEAFLASSVERKFFSKLNGARSLWARLRSAAPQDPRT